jgi:AraC-like DNA-binding protein
MSPDGLSVGIDLRAGLVIDLDRGRGVDLHTHDHHQLAATARGVLAMTVDRRSWVLPRTRGRWIPAGIPHSVAAGGPAIMPTVYVDPIGCPITWEAPTVVEASGLLGELIGRLAHADLSSGERARAEALMWDVIEPLSVTTLSLPLPADDRARQVAESILADVTDARTLAAWGRAVGASGRTLARLFVAETGMGFERWRTTARLAAALPLLAGAGPCRRRRTRLAMRRRVHSSPRSVERLASLPPSTSNTRDPWAERREVSSADQAGDPALVVIVRDVPAPEPGPNEVVVRVDASVIQPADSMFTRGRYRIQPDFPQVRTRRHRDRHHG